MVCVPRCTTATTRWCSAGRRWSVRRATVVAALVLVVVGLCVGGFLAYIRHGTSADTKVQLLTETALSFMGAGNNDGNDRLHQRSNHQQQMAVVYICLWHCDTSLLALSIKTLRARGGWCGDVYVAVGNSERRALAMHGHLPPRTHFALINNPRRLCTSHRMQTSMCAKRLKPQLFSLVPATVHTLLYIDADVLVSRPLHSLWDLPRAARGAETWHVFPDMLCSDCTHFNTGIMLLHRRQTLPAAVPGPRPAHRGPTASTHECNQATCMRHEQVVAVPGASPSTSPSLHTCLALWLIAMDSGLFSRDQEALDAALGLPLPMLPDSVAEEAQAVLLQRFAQSAPIPCRSHPATGGDSGGGLKCLQSVQAGCRRLLHMLPRRRQRYLDSGMWQPLLAYHEWFVHLLGIKRDRKLWPRVRRFYLDSEQRLLQSPRCPITDYSGDAAAHQHGRTIHCSVSPCGCVQAP
ncbi:hypothetical protein PTSG_06256 [Salpingoeca rosetta]|uniref:Uncharacterized protein n=1 Tax=Salpingoeca rosetta (strain ATCC 50818 / BSB-021) TaxID=946362 RepID=F2UCD9_SALR5|nr:uncharacterized protein PTSG_06256 [Salpingoeca rosetta]EGD74246.1 hypothetical protein PTSG_06256 [Salpingoeca rosetta]|eukprot:XP_004993146.1 hypothetical protein PTSG_06256 [Salpingoeca rosetta]